MKSQFKNYTKHLTKQISTEMLNREKEMSSKQKDAKIQRFQISKSSLGKNKINIRRCHSNQSLFRSQTLRDKSQDCSALVKITPDSLHFQSIEPNKSYEMAFFIRNQSSQIQKVRIIPPVKKQFKIKYNEDFNSEIASGLNVKILVVFNSPKQFEQIEDKIFVMGISFKHQVALLAESPRAKFQFAKFLNMGTLIIKQQRFIEIPIKNSGFKSGSISVEDIMSNEYCPHISYENISLIIPPGKTETLQISLKPIVIGPLQLTVKLSNLDVCVIKGVVVEEQVQIIEENGSKVLAKDFGELFAGQKASWHFFVSNGTQNIVDCILQTLNQKRENADVKVDVKRNIFISQSSPQQFSVSVQSSSFTLEKTSLQIKPFSSFKNVIYVQKPPSNDQIEAFIQNLTKNIPTTIYKAQHAIEINKILRKIQNPNEMDKILTGRSATSAFQNNSIQKLSEKDKLINETLAIKFSNQQKISKIPIKFFSTIPNLEIDNNILEFSKIYIKETEVKQFVLKNYSSRKVKLTFNDFSSSLKDNFKIEGPEILEPQSETIFKINFRPLIKKKFAQTLRIMVFDFFPIEIKIFGECMGLDGNLMKTQMNFTMTSRNGTKNGFFKSFLNDTFRLPNESLNQTFQQKTGQSLSKSKKTQSLNNLLIHPLKLNKLKQLQKSEDGEIAKVLFNSRQQNMADQKQFKQGLFFRKQEFLTSIQRKKNFEPVKNAKEVLKYETLSLEELKKIEVSDKKLEFGHVFVGSQMSKKLIIKNRLESALLFQLDTLGAQALAENSEQGVKIQGCSTYEVDIVLHPKQLGELQLSLNYIINREHVFEVKVLATVTLVNLELSSRSFVFNLQEDDPSFQKQEILQVYNNGNKKTKFSFETPKNSSFKLSPLQGELQPNSYMTIKIIYAPYFGGESGEQKIQVQNLKLKVHEGAQNIIKCTGSVKEPKISIKQTQYKCQNCIISVPITSKISLRNFSKVQTYVKIQFQPLNSKQKKQQFRSLFTIDNQVHTLNGDQKKDITFTFVCNQIRRIQGNIILYIRGYKIVRIPFSVNLIYPQIVSLTPQIDFQDVPIMGNYCVQIFSLMNMTSTQIKLQMDTMVPKDQYSCEILPVDNCNLETNYDEERLKTYVSNYAVPFKENKSKRKSVLYNKVLVLPPNGNENVFNLKFVPKLIKKYDLQLPLKVYGTGDKIIKPVNLKIKCNAVEPEIYVEPRSIKFDSKVITEGKTSYSQTLYISNRHDQPVKFKISSLGKNSQISSRRQPASMFSAFNQKIKKQEFASTHSISGTENFVFSQYEGEIQAQGKIQVFVIFRCVVQGQFFEKFSISLIPKCEGQQQSRPTNTAVSTYVLDVSGSSIMPTLRFNCNQAIMPVIPLNLQSRTFIIIQNHGYDAITICKWKTSNHFPHTEIKVNFIEGKLLSLAKKSLKIQVLFSSLAPISFTTMLEIYDQFGNKYELPLSCTADNSIFTTFFYLQSDSTYTILFNGDEKIIKVIPTGKNSYYQHNKQIIGNHTMSCLFIQKWLNFQINLNIDSYPKSVIQSDGTEFMKMVNRIASKNIIKKFELVESSHQIEETKSSQSFINEFKMGFSKGRVSKILQIIGLYSDTIRQLKQQGAFLNHIRPEYLLSYSQYINYQNYRQKLIVSYVAFQVLSVESWVCLFYQLCKIYIQPQINDRILGKMKVQNGIVSQNITSNLYSNVEIMLIKFINFYLSPEEMRTKSQSNMMVSFGEQIKIFEVIQRVLESNFQLSLTEQINTLKSSISTLSPHAFLSTIAKFLHTQLKQYGLSAYLGPTDLFTIGVKQLILYLINMVQMIYHYSNPNCVKFQGAVGDKITKVIELQNPTNKKVTYFVKIVNNQTHNIEKQMTKNSKSSETQLKQIPTQSNYKPKQSSFIPQKYHVTIQPKQKAELKIIYNCKNAKGQTSNLYLIPSKQDDDSTLPQPLLFKLTTTILSKIVIKKIILSTSLYEVLPIHLDVELPSQIPQSVEFTLSIFEQFSKQQSQNNNAFHFPSFIFSQSHIRTLKQGNRDSLELKLVPLNVGDKICRISYFSPIYGEFIYEIFVKVSNPKILKQIRIKDLKVNTQQQIIVSISKQNQLFYSIAKIYYPQLYNFHMRTQKSLPVQTTKGSKISSGSKLNFNLMEKLLPKDLRYEVEILDTHYVSLSRGSEWIEKIGQENSIVLKTLFTKPFKQYPVILSVKNELLKDRRLYKLIFAAISPPKIIKLNFRTTARQQIIQKLPIKLTPCDVSLKSDCEFFSIQNLQRQYYSNTDIICHFNPRWMLEKEVRVEIQNKQSLQQLIYEISLRAQQPQSFGTYELIGSSLFNQQVSIPIDIQTVFIQDNKLLFQINNKSLLNPNSNYNSVSKSIYYQVKRIFKRQHTIQSEQFYPFSTIKTVKSQTGIYLKSIESGNKVEKQNGEKNVKTKSMVHDKNVKFINLTLYPSQTETQTGVIRLMRPFTQEYYWARVLIKNRAVEKLTQVLFEQKINMTKIECLQDLLSSYNIDFQVMDFEYKFQKQSKNLVFRMVDMQQKNKSIKKYTYTNYGRRQRPALMFTPLKQTQSHNTFYFKANNKQYMLPIILRAQPLATIVVPQITTINTEAKLTYLNLLNGTDQTGTYKVKIVGQNQFDKLECFKFIEDDKDEWIMEKGNCTTSTVMKQKKVEDLIYYLKPKQKKEIRIAFAPKFIHQKGKLIIRFQSDTLPNYTYILNGRSQFKIQQQKDQFEVYQNHIQPFHIKFTNLFQKKQYFTIDLQPLELDKHNKIQHYIKIEQPANKKFQLQEGEAKIILLSLPEQYFKLSFEQMKSTVTNSQTTDPSGLRLIVNIRVVGKVVKRYQLSLLIIKNLFSVHDDMKQEYLSKLKQPGKKSQRNSLKNIGIMFKNEFIWHCKARQTVYENIQIPHQLNFFVKEIKSPLQVSKYLTFTCISQQEKSAHQIGKFQSNILKLKYSPMKPIKKKRYDLILIGTKGEKYRIESEISVDEPPIDDTIVIKTSQIDQVGCVSFKLTNITKLPAKFKGYFVKKLPQFSLQTQNGYLQGYGKPGTPIMVKFKSHINNRRLEDKLILQTEDMYWCFKVKGMLSKD